MLTLYLFIQNFHALQDIQNQGHVDYPNDEGTALSWFIMGAAACYIYLKIRGRVDD